MTGMGTRLADAMSAHGPVCVGIDPHPGLLDAWGLPDSVDGLRAFAEAVLAGVGGRVAAVKPQSAFFERHGSGGIAVLEQVVAECRRLGTVCIVDAKRGDIGSTMAAYGDAYCREGSPLAGDAVTVSPFLGFGSLEPALATALANDRGLFVLALTSNPEGPTVQHAVTADGVTVAGAIVAAAARANAAQVAAGERLGSVGLVVGATIGDAADRLGIDLSTVAGPMLAPGVGAQGATADDLVRVFGDARSAVLASVSRGVLGAGPSPAALWDATRRVVDQAAAALGQ